MDEFAQKLLGWYQQNKRDLPWRHTTDPYKIWLSEIILQQTRVAQGLPYYEKFIEAYPRIQDLAAASEQEVLRLWQGLGYYSRARNMLQSAKIICEEFGAVFPTDFEALQKIKGVGPYTAAAIASFAFEQKVPVVDGNVIRVISRIFGIQDDVAAAATKNQIFKIAHSLIGNSKPSVFNQAIMEFGALMCTPKKPSCTSCTFEGACFAKKQNLIQFIPFKGKKTLINNRYVIFYVIRKQGRIFMKKRNSGDIWQGLYDFPSIETQKPADENFIISSVKNLDFSYNQLIFRKLFESVLHVLSHQRIFATFVEFELIENANRVMEELLGINEGFFETEEIQELPKPVLISKFLNNMLNHKS